MVEEKPNKYDRHRSLPIPTYDEAVDPHQSSSQSFRTPAAISSNAETQGLLWEGEQNGYQAPTVESTRASFSFSNTSRASTEELRHEMLTPMEVLEPGADGGSTRATLLRRNEFSKRIISLTHRLSFLSIRQWLPCRNYFVANIPTLIRQIQPNWAINLSRLFAFALVVTLVYLLFFSHILTVGRKGPGSMMNFPDTIREFARSNANASRIRENSKYLTLFDHVAGTKGSYVLGEYIQDLFVESLLEDVHKEQFDVYASNQTCHSYVLH